MTYTLKTSFQIKVSPDTVYAFFKEVYGQYSWTKEQFLHEQQKEKSIFIYIFVQQKLIACLQAHYLFDEGEIYNIAVLPEYQRQGLAGRLFEQLLILLHEKNVHTLFLEVRTSNQKAIQCYQKVGFTYQGVRKKYYKHPLEDAQLFTLHF